MSTVNPKLRQRAAQLALSTIPQYANITVSIDADGNIVYTDKVTGNTSVNSLDEVVNSRLGLVDYRFFDPGTGRGPLASIGSNAGALQLDSEVMVVNQFLRAARTDPEKAQQLRNLGLGHMIDQEVTGEFLKFNTRGQSSIVQSVKRLAAQKGAASTSITDEGYSLLVLKGKNREITATQASYLRILSGAEQVQPRFLAQLAEVSEDGSQNWSKIGKLAKRLQSTMSPRNVAVGEEFIKTILDTTLTTKGPFSYAVPFQDRALVIDGVGARFALMFGDSKTDYGMTPAEREFAMAGVGGDPIVLTKAEKALRGKARTDIIKMRWDQRLIRRREKELESLRTTHGLQDWEIDRMRTMFDEARTELSDTSHALHASSMTSVQKEFKLVKEKIDKLEKSKIKGLSGFAKRMKSTFTGMEKARDGQYYITESLVKDMRAGFQSELDSILNGINSAGVTTTLEQTQTVRELQKQIEHLNNTLEKIGSNSDVIARVNIGIGQFKGEAMVISDRRANKFRDPITGLVPYVIGDVSALKKEVGSNLARNILFDVGESSTEVFSDPLMMLYHGDYFTQPAMIASMRQNAAYSLEKTQQFMQSGVAPKEVMEALRQDIEGDLKVIKDVMLDPQTRMSHLRKKREAEEIMSQMASGIRANEIPAMVRRVSDHYSAQVVRFKNGRSDVVMPTASRFSLRTFESRQVLAENFDDIRKTSVDLSHYGIKSSGSDTLSTVGFRLKGHTLMMSGDAAYLYQHSLGGFDLDDKGIPLMSTFQGVGGRKRLAFLTLRQPTSFQESLAMSADLSDAETVNSLFENNEKFRLALRDDTVLSSLGIDKKSKAYQDLDKMVNGSKADRSRMDRESVKQDEIEDLIIKISEEHVYPEGLPQLTNSQVVQMVAAKSPSVLGLDKMIKDPVTGILSPYGEYIKKLGMDPSEIPVGYDSDLIFQVLKKSAEQDQNTRLLAEASSVLGYTVRDAEHIGEILRGGGAGYRPGDDVRLTERMTRLAEDIMASSADSDPASSIGVFVNRQSASVSVLESSRKVLLGDAKLGVTASSDAYDRFVGMSSMLTLPASEAVDVNKQVGAEYVLHNFGTAVSLARQQGVPEDAIEQALKAYVETLKSPTFSPLAAIDSIPGLNAAELNALKIPMELSGIGEQSLRAFSSVGYVRGRQMAEQVSRTGSIDVNELYGLQQTMFEGEFGRVGVGADQATVRNEILRGLRAASDELTAGPEKDALESHYRELSAKTAEESLKSIYMKAGTSAYQKYAELDQMTRAIMDIRSGAEAVSNQAIMNARNAGRNLDPVSRALYQDSIENVVGTVSQGLTSLKDKVTALKTGDDLGAVGIKSLRTEVLSDIHKGLSAAMEVAGIDLATDAGRAMGANQALDIMETLSASLQSKLGYETGKLIISPTLLEDGSDAGITTMANMSSAMTKRIIANSSLKRADKLAVMRADDAYRSIGELRTKAEEILGSKLASSMAPGTGLSAGILGSAPVPISTNLAEMTRDEALALIEASRKIRKGKAGTARALSPEEIIVTQFAGRVKDGVEGQGTDPLFRVGETAESANAFMYHIAGRRQLEQAGEQAAEAMKGFLSGDDIPTVTRDAVTRSRSTARTAFSAGTAYKRMSESFKTGALGDALKNKGVRTGLAAAAALSVFGFVRSYRRDHSADDASGPPLLPGGSAYESGYPARQAVIDNLRTLNPLTRGMQYKVYTSGSSEDAEKLRSMVGGVTDGEVSSTMYSSLPLLGQDPYSQVASKF